MRSDTIVGPTLFAIAIAAAPGASIAVQVLAVALAIAPALAGVAHAGTEKLRRGSGQPGVGRAPAPPAAERSER